MDGKLIPSYEIHCATCERPNLGLGNSRAKAEKALKRSQWRLRGGKWICDTCSLRENAR